MMFFLLPLISLFSAMIIALIRLRLEVAMQ